MAIKTYSILVIDDQDDIKEMISYQLQALGYVVKTASNGIEGLESLRTFTPDLIILDINMPKMDGIAFYREICDKDNMPKYSVIVHTARIELAQFFLDFNVDGFLSKPADINELLKEVNLVLKRKSRQKDPLTGDKNIKNIFIIEDDKDEYLKIQTAFKKSGYKIDNSNSGVEAILKMLDNPPDVVLTKLGLKDIPGDVIALRLKTFARTSDAHTIVYINNESVSLNFNTVQDKISQKTGVAELIRYNNGKDLLDAVDRILSNND